MTMMQATGMTAAAEVWRVDDAQSCATLGEGVYGDAEAMRLCSDGLKVVSGQGLVGAVLARRVPVLLGTLDAENFERTEAAAACGICSALALPVFDGPAVTSVAVVMFRGGAGMTGAVELWAGRRGRLELGLTEAAYAGLDRFGAISRYVNFPMGSGLPGKVWESQCPGLLTGLGGSRLFLRSSGAEIAGLTTGFGFPVIYRNELTAVMVWLSSSATPLARLHEVWAGGDGAAGSLVCVASDRSDAAAHADRAMPLAVERAAAQRRPVVFEEEAQAGGPLGVGMSGGLALPVLVHDQVRAVAMLAW